MTILQRCLSTITLYTELELILLEGNEITSSLSFLRLIFALSYAKIPFVIWRKHSKVYMSFGKSHPQTILPRSFIKWVMSKIFWWRIKNVFDFYFFFLLHEKYNFFIAYTINQRIHSLKYHSLFFLKRLKDIFCRDKVLINVIKCN